MLMRHLHWAARNSLSRPPAQVYRHVARSMPCPGVPWKVQTGGHPTESVHGHSDIKVSTDLARQALGAHVAALSSMDEAIIKTRNHTNMAEQLVLWKPCLQPILGVGTEALCHEPTGISTCSIWGGRLCTRAKMTGPVTWHPETVAKCPSIGPRRTMQPSVRMSS